MTCKLLECLLMKGNKLILLVLSVLLLTMSSGLLFYRNLFLQDTLGTAGKIDFEELRYTDLQINASAAMLRINFSADSEVLESETVRIKELLNIVTDVNRSSPELNRSIIKISEYFNKKIEKIAIFKSDLLELRKAVNSLNSAYNDLNQSKIKFSVDNRDFYRECIVNALSYISFPDKDNEARVNEDLKILAQIINFANSPNPKIQKFNSLIDTISRKTKNLDKSLEVFNSINSITPELNIISKYYAESQQSNTRDGEFFLTMVFAAILLYLISVILIIRKLT